MSCCTNTYNLGCFNNCSIIAVGLCLTSGTYNGVFTYGNISTTITVTAIENEPFLFDLSLLNENATFTLVIYDENENQITLTIDSVDYDCFKVKTQVDSVKVTQGTIIGCTPMCKEIYDPNDENTAVLFTVAVDGTTITGDGTVGNPLIAIGGGGGGGIESIVAGDNITIDNTDPLNPVINAENNLFPNGVKLVLSSRDFQADDKDFVLYCPVPSTIITMPTTNPFSEGDYIGVVMSSPDSYFETYNNGSGGTDKMYPFTANPTGTTLEQQSSSEVVILRALNQGTLWILPLCGAVRTSVDINGSNFKTLNRYNYDESQNAIPLSGTEVGKPVTGDIEVLEGNKGNLYINPDFDLYHSLLLAEGGIGFISTQDNFLTTTEISCNIDYICISSSNPLSRGLVGIQDYSANITDLDYTQKIYVDAKATSKQDTLVSGTNIKTINGTTILGSGDMTVGGQVDILQIQMFI